MKIHPSVLEAHAQFGGDLETMQKLYEWQGLRDVNSRLVSTLKLAKGHAEFEDEVLDIIDDAINEAEATLPAREPIVLEFGNGKFVVGAITIKNHPGRHFVAINPAKQAGNVGEVTHERENRTNIKGDEVLLSFPTFAQASRVSDAICNVASTTSGGAMHQDIAEDVMKAALDTASRIYPVEDDGRAYLSSDDIEEIAKAIMAERSRCAEIANRYAQASLGIDDPNGAAYYACSEVSAEIRTLNQKERPSVEVNDDDDLPW